MKKLNLIYFIFSVVLFFSCGPEISDELPDFKDAIDFTIYDYIVEHEEEYSDFLQIIEQGQIAQALAAYNPYGQGYTLFLPNNDAINSFITASNRFNSLADLLNDQEYVDEFCRYHVINISINSNDFPFGAFPEKTLSDDYLTVSFINESDSSYYKINNMAAVVRPNIEASNGYIHVVGAALTPITFTASEWLSSNTDYSIFHEALLLTGLDSVINITESEDVLTNSTTVLVEADSIYQKFNITSITDLINLISPDNDDYTNEYNPLYNFVAYHLLKGSYFIDDFSDVNTLYFTNSSFSVNINGLGQDILINKGKHIFDTLIGETDTTYIDYILFKYDESNVISKTGPIHFIDKLMRAERQSPRQVTFDFSNEPLVQIMRYEGGSFLLDPFESLQTINWSGSDLFYTKYIGEWQEGYPANSDMLSIDGDFTISYEIPTVIPGSYELIIRAHGKDQKNAVIEVFFDNRKIGGLSDLTNYGNNNNPYQNILVGQVDITSVKSHVVEIRPLIPGRLLWDFVRFEPIK